MKYYLGDEKGIAHVLTAVLLVLVVLAGGLAVYNFENAKSRLPSLGTSPSPSPSSSFASSSSPSPAPAASCDSKTNSNTPSGWKVASSGVAGYSFSYPSGWLCRMAENNGGAEVIDIDSSSYSAGPPYFEIEFLSFASSSAYGKDSLKANPQGACTGCLIVNSTQPLTAPGYGPLQLVSVKLGADPGSLNQLLLETPSGSLNIPSPRFKNVFSALSGNFQAESWQSQTAETYAEFSADPRVQTAEQVMKSLTY